MQDCIASYHIVCIADEAYAQHAAVMLASLVDTNPGKRFEVHVLTTGFSADTIGRLGKVLHGAGELHCYKVDVEAWGIGELKTQTSTKAWNPIMYLKCVIPGYLPPEVESFVFLDVDMVIRHDIQPLFDIQSTDPSKVIWACEDYKYQAGIKARLGLNEEDLYFNSGVMSVNLKSWREKESDGTIIDCLNANREIINNDQDALALYFKGQIGLLPTNRWNATTFFFEEEPRILDKYLPELESVRKDPYIVHYCEPVKPWFHDCHHPYRHLYQKYLNQTPWSDYRYPCFGNRISYSFWKNELKYWLNRWGIRREPMALVNIDNRE